jgi:hypothetical protein
MHSALHFASRVAERGKCIVLPRIERRNQHDKLWHFAG